MSYLRGRCMVCSHDHARRTDGTMWAHHRPRCDGSHRWPARGSAAGWLPAVPVPDLTAKPDDGHTTIQDHSTPRSADFCAPEDRWWSMQAVRFHRWAQVHG